MQCRHFPDRNVENNRIENISWGTPHQNVRDKKTHGTILAGESHHFSRLSEQEVVRIREEYSTGMFMQHELATEYGVTQTEVSHIVCGRSWKNAGGPITRVGHRRALTDEQIREIRASTGRQWEVADLYGLTQTMVSQIKHRKIYRHVE
jgi:predicted XRE-type DNA-binding protein